MSVNRLPEELYAEIIAHIQDEEDLNSVSLTSRSLYNETLPFIWHSVKVGKHSDLLSTYLSANPRIARYIRALKILIPVECPLKSFHNILLATINLKDLEIYQISSPPLPIILSDLTSGTTFKLYRLLSMVDFMPVCAEFFHGQDQLVEFQSYHFTIPPDFFLPPDFLPSLKICRIANGDMVLPIMRGITHLNWAYPPQTLAGQFPALQVLQSGTKPLWSEWEKFPNLRYITVLRYSRHHTIQIVENLRKLKYITLFHPPDVNSYESSADFAQEIFGYNIALEGVEIIFLKQVPAIQRWRFERSCDLIVPSFPPLGLPGLNDWKKW